MVNPQSSARSAIVRWPSTLHNSAQSYGPSTTSLAAASDVDSTGTASAPPTRSAIWCQRSSRSRASSSNSATSTGGATSCRVRRPPQNLCAFTRQCSRSATWSRTCSRTNASTTSRSTKPRWTSSSPSRHPCSSVRCTSSASASDSGVSEPDDISRTPSRGRRPGTDTEYTSPSRNQTTDCSPSGSVTVRAPVACSAASSNRMRSTFVLRPTSPTPASLAPVVITAGVARRQLFQGGYRPVVRRR